MANLHDSALLQLELEQERGWLKDNLARDLRALANSVTKLADNLDNAREVRWLANHSQGYGFETLKIERALTRLDLLNRILPEGGA